MTTIHGEGPGIWSGGTDQAFWFGHTLFASDGSGVTLDRFKLDRFRAARHWLRMELHTPRLILRSARPDDLDGLHAVLSDPRATLWWSTPPHETLDQTRVWLNAMIETGPENPDFVVELDGRVIGKAGFYVLPDVGYILHPDCWGQGLASEAVGAAIDLVFGTRDLDILTADVDPENAASIRLLERLGFVRTGFAERTWNVGGTWKDSIYYALSRADRAIRAAGQAPA